MATLASARIAAIVRRRRQRGLVRAAPLIALVVVGFLLSLAGTLARLQAGRGGMATVTLALGSLYLGAALAAGVIGYVRRRPRLVPYLERAVGPATATAFARGAALARAIDALDDAARRRGATPLSDYGFADDHEGDTVEWHPAAAGLLSIGAVLAEGPTEPEVAADLAALRDVLTVADAACVRFCLVVHEGDTQSVSHEHGRQGVLR